MSNITSHIQSDSDQIHALIEQEAPLTDDQVDTLLNLVNEADCIAQTEYIPDHTFARYLTGRHRRIARKCFLVATLAALLACLLVFASADSSALARLGKWTSERFSWSSVEEDNVVTVQDISTQSYDSMELALIALQIDEIQSPGYIPNGFIENSATVFTDGTTVNAYFDFLPASTAGDNNTSGFMIAIMSLDPSSKQIYEKEDIETRTIYEQGTTFYFFENSENNTIVWDTEHYTCSITGDLTCSEAQKISISMLKGE